MIGLLCFALAVLASPFKSQLRLHFSVLVIGQKSGVVHALDPDQEGKILWQTRIGKGGPLGGTEWGSAADQDRVYVANSDVRFDGTRRLNSNEGGGLFALDLSTGKIAMQVAPVACGDRSQCSPALSAAVTLIPGVVFSGGVSGYLRAYATDDARLLWEIDTARDYATVNGVLARGGAMDGPGPIVVNGMLFRVHVAHWHRNESEKAHRNESNQDAQNVPARVGYQLVIGLQKLAGCVDEVSPKAIIFSNSLRMH